ncbi:helix-turn-helix domain-containing protein [Buttiauxella sp. S19-1]|uniref:helix-turn-helix domain-containing protein n=1 Tax=Buttiauxella sp. S19-1 TaxID=941430 RepID=UPI001ED9E57C|nr:helix-turn-helix domain-containing protein [Buttiauxella sp. S19-1]
MKIGQFMGNTNKKDGESLNPPLYLIRPVTDIVALRKALSGSGIKQSFLAEDIINAIGEEGKHLYLFEGGEYTFLRSSDGLVIWSARGELIYGIAECIRPRGGWSLRIEEPCDCWVVPAEKAFEIITQKQLWESVANIFAWYLQIFTSREEHLVGVPAYVMIRTKLLELQAQPEDFRRDMNVADYIQQRTQLARSTIMAILGELRRGDYIEIKRGRLVAVNHLPKEY